jgi:hypothetical protein
MRGDGCRYAAGDGRAGFASPQLGARFRAAAFATHRLAAPGAKSGGAKTGPPRTITLLTAADGEEVRGSSFFSRANPPKPCTAAVFYSAPRGPEYGKPCNSPGNTDSGKLC